MCLTDLERFTPAKKGWQVKRRALGMRHHYFSVFHGSEMYQLGKTYEAASHPINTETGFTGVEYGKRRRRPYMSGFHVFNRLEDAQRYLQARGGPPNEYCIIQVECGGTKTTGYQEFEYLAMTTRGAHMFTCKAKVTVCKTITLLKEVSYGTIKNK